MVMFVNTDVPISLKWDFCAPKRLGAELGTAATWYFVDKFGLAAHIKGQFQMHNQAPWIAKDELRASHRRCSILRTCSRFFATSRPTGKVK